MKDIQLEKINNIIKEDQSLLKPSEKFFDFIQLKFDKEFMFINADGNIYKIKLKGYSDKLYNANIKDRLNYNVSNEGYGINWEKLDEDLSVRGLIKDGLKIEQKDSPFKKRLITSKSVKA